MQKNFTVFKSCIANIKQFLIEVNEEELILYKLILIGIMLVIVFTSEVNLSL